MNMQTAMLFGSLWTMVALCFTTGIIAEQFCQSETFRPRCHNGEAVVITKAVYGRMTFDSRCLQDERQLPVLMNDPEYIGCSENVLQSVSRRCSGFSNCEIRIMDPEMDETNPCYRHMVKYLEVAYHCITIVQTGRSCEVRVNSDKLFLSNSIPSQSDTACGSRDRPWLLEAPPGQRINVSLLDFTASSSTSNRPTQTDVQQQQQHQSTSSDCQRELGFIEDKSAKRNVNICTDSTRRQRTLHLSASNQLAIVLTTGQQPAPNVLISVHAVGCSDVVPPRDAWLKRVDNVATVGCYMTRQTWILTCDQRRSRWTGTFGNCTQQLQALSQSDDSIVSLESRTEPHNDNDKVMVVLVVVTGVSVLVCIVILLVGTTWLCRVAGNRKARGRSYSASEPLTSPEMKSNVGCTAPRLPSA